MFFHSHLDTLNFISPDKEEGVFVCFPISARQSLSVLICENILSGAVQPSQLATPVHVRIMLECVGQAFSLPLEAYHTIESAVEIYRRWLLDAKRQPPPIVEDEQFFYKEMFKHLSLVFTRRVPNEPADVPTTDTKGPNRQLQKEAFQMLQDQLAIHTNICNSVLDLYRNVGVQLGKRMMDDTWEVLLKIILGVSDSMLSEPVGTSIVAEQLVSNLLNLLFELWLHSGSRPDVMWDKLSELSKKWKHRMQIFSQWSETCNALNQRLLRLLYGPTQGTAIIQFQRVNGKVVELVLDDGYMFVAWYRMLHLLGMFDGAVNISENYFEAIKGICKIAKSYILLNENVLPKGITPPRGDNILHMCGGWLLEAINHYQNGFDDGKMEAIDTICALFSSRPAHHFQPEYLAHFYRGIEKALNTRNSNLLAVILRSCVSFFQNDYRGSHILIPAFVIAIERVLFSHIPSSVAKELQVKPGSATVSIPDMQHAAFKIIYAWLCLPNHYHAVPLHSTSSNAEPLLDHLPTLATFNDLSSHLIEMLCAGLQHVHSPENRQLVLWGACVFAFENSDIQAHSGYANRLMDMLLDKITIDQWGSNEVLTTLMIIRDLSQLLPQMQANNEHIAAKILTTICKFIQHKLLSKLTAEEESLILVAYELCLTWILADQWILNYPAKLLDLLTVVESGSKYENIEKDNSVGKKIKSASNYFFAALLNFFGNFPLASTPASVSSLRSEKNLVESDNRLVPDTVKAFAFNSNLLTVIRFPRATGIELYCVARDNVCRSIWHNRRNYYVTPVSYPDPLDSAPVSACHIPVRVTLAEVSEELTANMTEEDKALHQDTHKFVEQQTQQEEQFLKRTGYGQNIDISIHAPKYNTDPPTSDPTTLRLFFTTLGINSLINATSFTPLKSKLDSYNEFPSFKFLDNISPQECYSAGVLFFGRNGNADNKVKTLPKDYTDFVWALGWQIDVATHAGYLGGLNPAETGAIAPYFSTYNVELIFHVSTLALHSTMGYAVMRKLIFSDQVIICWAEDMALVDTALLENETHVFLVIVPLPTKLYRIRVLHSRASSFPFGPLQNDMIVSKHVLAPLVRMTTLNILRGVGCSAEPTTHRGILMDKIERDNNASKSLYKYYHSLFA